MNDKFQEYPKWIYPAGVKEAYDAGEEPYLVLEPELEDKPKRGRPAKVSE